MLDTIDPLYKPVLEKSNLSTDPTGQRLVINIPVHANIGLDTFGYHAKGKNSSKAESDSIKYYSLSGSKKKKSEGVSYSKILGDSLIQISDKNDNFKCKKF